MNVGRYELLIQLDAGPDAVVYHGTDPAEGPVEVRVLSGARADPLRWPLLCKRLRLAAMVKHPAVLVTRELGLDQDPPFAAYESLERRTLFEECQGGQSLTIGRALELAAAAAGAVTAAHLLGLVHGRLSPNTLQVAADRGLVVDFVHFDGPKTLHADGQPGSPVGRALDLSCRAPEQQEGETIGQADVAADVYGLAAVLFWLLTRTPAPAQSIGNNKNAPVSIATGHKQADAAIERLIIECLAADPAERPSAAQVERRLLEILGLDGLGFGEVPSGALARAQTLREDPAAGISLKEGMTRDRLGRFRLLQELGHGAMGVVYRAEDSADGSIVAIKVLRPHLLEDPQSLRRFRKEARILAQLHSPFIANLLEVNEDDGVHFLVLEFVRGDNLAQLLDRSGRLQETQAISIMADVARGLVDAHERGIVHRDIKPGNIWLESGEPPALAGGGNQESGEPPASAEGVNHSGALPPLTREARLDTRARLLDFGLARHMVETASLQVTQAGAPVGTPLYMAPEQGLGKGVDTRSDVYAMGATLFHMLTGRPPFEVGDPLLGPVGIILKHAKEPLPSPKKLNPALSDGVCQVLEKALAKSPDARYADAGAMLRDLERILRGEPTEIALHPKLPACDAGRVFQFDWVWDLQASPEQLWPYVSNTERLNRAATIPPVNYTTQPDAHGGVRLFGQFRKAGFNNVWEEHPYEWIEGRRMAVLREYSQGVFLFLMTVTELEPLPEGGTRLTHRVRILPRNLIGRLVARIEVGIRGRSAVEKVYRRIDALLTGKLGNPALTDAFEAPPPLSASGRQRLEALLAELRKRGVAASIVEKLGQFIANAPPQEAARIRPIALARHLNLDVDQFVAACLHAAQAGLLVLLWDLLCPVCRIPSGVKETLKALEDHSHCDVCNLDFPIDFTRSVEMIFRVQPQIRSSDLATYCLGGPDHSPHVVVQVRLGGHERMELPIDLPAGAYQVRGPQLPFSVDFRVSAAGSGRRLELTIGDRKGVLPAQMLRAGGQVLCLSNEQDREVVIRVERTAARADALTAARASSLALFRELFPGEVLSAGHLVSVATVTLLATDVVDAGRLYNEIGEERTFGLIHEHFRILEEEIRREGGALVKTMDERLLAAFEDPTAALRAAWQFPALLAARASTRVLQLRCGIHRGPALVANFNDQLDYFGGTVKTVLQLPQLGGPGEVILSQTVATDPAVAAWLRSLGLQPRVAAADLFGGPGSIYHLSANGAVALK